MRNFRSSEDLDRYPATDAPTSPTPSTAKSQKTFNSAINKTRAVIEQVVSHVKNWRILHTDYRRPLATFPTTISAVVGLHFWLNG